MDEEADDLAGGRSRDVYSSLMNDSADIIGQLHEIREQLQQHNESGSDSDSDCSAAARAAVAALGSGGDGGSDKYEDEEDDDAEEEQELQRRFAGHLHSLESQLNQLQSSAARQSAEAEREALQETEDTLRQRRTEQAEVAALAHPGGDAHDTDSEEDAGAAGSVTGNTTLSGQDTPALLEAAGWAVNESRGINADSTLPHQQLQQPNNTTLNLFDQLAHTTLRGSVVQDPRASTGANRSVGQLSRWELGVADAWASSSSASAASATAVTRESFLRARAVEDPGRGATLTSVSKCIPAPAAGAGSARAPATLRAAAAHGASLATEHATELNRSGLFIRGDLSSPFSHIFFVCYGPEIGYGGSCGDSKGAAARWEAHSIHWSNSLSRRV